MRRAAPIFSPISQALAACALIIAANGQLAITEMMSAHLGPADYFELTNFGTNTANLEGYKFTDADHKKDREVLVPGGQTTLLSAGQSIIFVRTNLTEAQFRAFWGPCLASNVLVRPYNKPGFSSFGDSLLIYDSKKKLVDEVEFRAAQNLISFTYDSSTGDFGTLSASDTNACISTTDHNIGSPGSTIGPVPLRIVRPPTDIVVCRQRSATLTVEAVGMPRPRYQWYFKDAAMRDANKQSLVVSDATEASEGAYFVQVSNGLTNIVSSVAILSLNTNSAPPSIEKPLGAITALEWRTAHFAIEVCGYPPPSFQWSSNGIPLPDETNRVLFIPTATREMSGSSFCVRVENQFGRADACGTLYVTNSSPIRITEIQANPQLGCDGHNDWFEVTNFGNNDAQMQGYRFLDDLNLEDAVVVDRPVTIHAQESIIFVKNSSVGTFFDWWGADQLPPHLQVIPYTGFNLSAGGDTLYLWNETAADKNEFIDSVALATNSVGLTLDYESPGLDGRENTPESPGVFRAVQCGDIGSPGFTHESPPQIIAFEKLSDGALLTWRAVRGFSYQLEYCDRLGGPWHLLKEVLATDNLPATTDQTLSNNTTRFYRIIRLPPP